MAKKTYRGVTRSRRLTASEAAKYRKIREQVEKEVPPAKPSPEKVAIGKLRAMREAKGISLSELAARTGMTRGSWRGWNRKRTRLHALFSDTRTDSTANWRSMSSQPRSKRDPAAERQVERQARMAAVRH